MPTLSNSLTQGELEDYFEACRQRIPTFVNSHFSLSGAFNLNRQALGSDILVAPFNFLMGFPNFLLRLLALLFELLGAKQTAQGMLKLHLGLPTAVQRELAQRLRRDLLELTPPLPTAADQQLQQPLREAADEPLQIYLQTRNVAADITAGTLVAILGLILLNQFTPGSISAGSAIAHIVAKQQAAANFFLGETLGNLYYAIFPVSPSLLIIAVTIVLVMVTIALVAAFSGMVHDPIQKLTGIHQRRLNRLLDAIEQSITQSMTKGYRPKDTFIGRVYDAIDWIKGLLSF
jgi:energy-converting hydrogenase Eha subunit B